MLLIMLNIAPDLTTADTMTNVMLQSRHMKLKVTKRVNKKTIKICTAYMKTYESLHIHKL